MKLKTKDILGVEVLSTGTFHGRGSPPEGDTYTEADLDNIVEAAAALPLLRPAKLGHGEQVWAQAEGGPAVGWLENVRRVGNKLLADVRKVPGKVADLIEAGAWRPRSPELYFNYTDQNGKVWPRVLRGLAFLGEEPPACNTLDDIIALYEGKLTPESLRSYMIDDAPCAELHTYVLGEGSEVNKESGSEPREMAVILPLSEEGSFENLTRQVKEALPTVPDRWWWIRRTYPTFVVASRETMGGDVQDLYIIGYEVTEDGVQIAPESEWQKVETEEVFVTAEYTEGEEDPDLLAKFTSLVSEMEGLIKGKTGAPRLRVWLQETQKGLSAIAAKAAKQVTDKAGEKDMSDAAENARTIGEPSMKNAVCLALGLPEDTPDDDVLAKIRELTEAETPETPEVDMKAYIAKDSEEYGELRTMAEEGRAAKTRLFEMERDLKLDKALAEGRITPADVEQWKADYAANAELTVRHLEALPKTVKLGASGSSEGGQEVRDLSDRKVLDETIKKYRSEHPGVTYEEALAAVQ